MTGSIFDNLMENPRNKFIRPTNYSKLLQELIKNRLEPKNI